MSFSFTYPDSPYNLITGTTIDISRNISGTEPAFVYYRISPSLPNNVNINPTNGSITGNALFSNITIPTQYLVDASSATIVTRSSLTLGINFAPSFVYTDSPYLLKINTTTLITPIYYIYNTINISYSITPNLPSGLFLNTTNGSIYGTPNILTGLIRYVIRANNFGIIYDAICTIAVETIPSVTYPSDSYTLTQGIASTIAPTIVPFQSGVTYSISDCPLPFGLSFNKQTGEITGIPTILTTFRNYKISATNNIGTAVAYIKINIIKEFLTTPVLADNFSTNTFLTNPAIQMRRKAEILKHKQNSSNLTKNQYLSLIARGNGPAARRAWGNQSDTNSNPNISGLLQDGNTIICNSPAIQCSLSSSSDVPGPVVSLCYNPDVPVIGYTAPNRTKISVGFKWPQKCWKAGDNGFPVGKAGNN